jgi:hypothetical protein
MIWTAAQVRDPGGNLVTLASPPSRPSSPAQPTALADRAAVQASIRLPYSLPTMGGGNPKFFAAGRSFCGPLAVVHGLRVERRPCGCAKPGRPRRVQAQCYRPRPVRRARICSSGSRVDAVAYDPIGRMGQPGEIAEAVVWLCSDAASFLNGHAMAFYGGLTAD